MLEEFSICEHWLGVAAIDFLVCLWFQLHTPCVFVGSRRACSPCWVDTDLPVSSVLLQDQFQLATTLGLVRVLVNKTSSVLWRRIWRPALFPSRMPI